MSDARPTPTPEERAQLCRFVRIVDATSRRRFIEKLREQDHSVSCGTEIKGPTYGREDFDAFLTDFRKVGMSDSEPVYLTKVLVMVGKLASDRLRASLKLLRAHIIPVLDGKLTMMGILFEGEGEVVALSPEQTISALVNGEMFHVNPKYTQTAAALRDLDPLFYLWPVIHFFIVPILRACIWLFHAIRQDGILDVVDYPARCLLTAPPQSG